MALKFVLLTTVTFLLTNADVPDYCQLPEHLGTCHFNAERYHFNTTSRQCQEIKYLGCPWMKNTFDTLKLCQMTCMTSFCLLPPDAGFCKANIQSFFYNKNSQRCETFTYRGCGGNRNRFQNKAECNEKCTILMKEKREICSLPEHGPCRSKWTYHTYKRASGTCEKTTRGGCKRYGNNNIFYTKKECLDFCADPTLRYW